MSELTPTIFARASGAGRAGVSVFRVSGPKVRAVMEAFVGKTLEPRQAYLRSITDVHGKILDEGLVLFFPGPASFTGEDVLEFHLHGALAVENAFYKRLSDFGCIMAEPGEFTLRALKSGKMDLAQVEGLSDLLEAQTQSQRLQALRQYGGALSESAQEWRKLLLGILASLAADIDFPDEGDVPQSVLEAGKQTISILEAALDDALATSEQAQLIREGVEVALIGAPNAGKSSLINILSGSEVAIVSDQPGTTRDIVEARLEIDGQLYILADTAGLRASSSDQIERAGMTRALSRAKTANVRILVIDASLPAQNVSRETIALLRSGDIIALNKNDRDNHKDIDQLSAILGLNVDQLVEANVTPISISATTGAGIEHLHKALSRVVVPSSGTEHAPLLTRHRHITHIKAALESLSRAKGQMTIHPELAAEDIRLAARSFAQITGEVGVEDVLGEIFSNFCIGK